MTIALVSFYASFAAIIGMISVKSHQLRTGKKTWLDILAEKTDHIVHAAYADVKRFISYFNRKSAIALVQFIAYHILSWIRKSYIWLRAKVHSHPPSKKVVDMVRGKVELEKTGGASLYLKQISEDK